MNLDIDGILSTHRQFGGGCAGCDWLTGHPALSLKDDHRAHVVAVLRDQIESALTAAKADGWDERSAARRQYLGPDDGHYPDDCMGWEDCRCASYPNPYRAAPTVETCGACSHPSSEHVGRWCRVPTGALNGDGRELICCCEAASAARA